jgi:hypothetical protein
LIVFLDGQEVLDAEQRMRARATHDAKVGSNTNFAVFLLVFEEAQQVLLNLT